MKKLRLHVESLAVETFETVVQEDPRGTVAAHADTDPESCDYSCHSLWPSDCCTADLTCPASCGGSCYWTCRATCDGHFTCGATCGHTEPNVCPI
jgi:hypothetical protein